MENIKLEIDGKPVQAEKGATILQAAQGDGINIPTLCNDDRLSPYGVCRLCIVEITRNKRTRLVTSCVYPVEEGLVVKTDTDRVKKFVP